MKTDIDNIKVGERIRDIRMKNGLTTEKFAELFDPPASKGTISKWENGRYLPNNERLVVIADFGKTTVNELLYGVKISFKEFSQSIYNKNETLTEWCKNTILEYFIFNEEEENRNQISSTKEFNLFMATNIIDFKLPDNDDPFEEKLVGCLMPIMWEYFIDKNFEYFLYSLYLVYVEDIEALTILDNTIHRILRNISLEDRTIYLNNMFGLIDDTLQQFKYSNFKMVEDKENSTRQKRVEIIKYEEYEIILNGLTDSLEYIEKLIEEEE